MKPRSSGLRPEAGLIVILTFLFENAILSPVGYLHSKLSSVEFEFSAGEFPGAGERVPFPFCVSKVSSLFYLASVLVFPVQSACR